ncbi:MAG: hypothetical protein RLY20_3345 [Verrucomicrobiota bacterium]|jgi:hypothetical protein
MNLNIAWIAQGRMRIKAGAEIPRTIDSKYGDGIRERAARSAQRHGWKMQGAGEKFLAGPSLWGRSVRDPAQISIQITSLCRGKGPGQALYSLEADGMCAVLSLEEFGKDELRVWNKNDKRLSHLCVSDAGDVACCAMNSAGTAHIAIRLNQESGFAEVTEGDVLDTAPRWIPGAGRRLVYQSAGIARNREGFRVGQSHFAIHQLDVDRGELSTLLDEPQNDLLTPQMTAEGALYFIRRPLQRGPKLNPFRVLLNIVLFPFRLLYAVFQFLQFFSLRYTGKPLTSGSGEQAREADLKQMIIWGNMVSAANAQPATGDDAPDLVPNSWQLVRRDPAGREKVLAKGVLSFDLAPDGTVIYSNGNAIFRLGTDGQRERIVREAMIQQVVVLHPEMPAAMV